MCTDEKKTIKIISISFLIVLVSIIIIDFNELSILNGKLEDFNDFNEVCLAIALKTTIAAIVFVVSIHALTKSFNNKLNYECMTGLYSRRKLFIDLNDLIDDNIPFALCYIDFDNFKIINDNYGHKAGDNLIKEFSRRVLQLKSQEITGYRIGGDEFIVIIKDNYNIDRCIENIWGITEDDVKISHKIFAKISFTMGIVENDFVSTPDELLAIADHNMYKKKRTLLKKVKS